MSSNEQLTKIREAYAGAVRKQPADCPALPAWFDLPPEMRAVIIRVFLRGGINAMDDADQWREENSRTVA
jgi:hypothetical protein